MVCCVFVIIQTDSTDRPGVPGRGVQWDIVCVNIQTDNTYRPGVPGRGEQFDIVCENLD